MLTAPSYSSDKSGLLDMVDKICRIGQCCCCRTCVVLSWVQVRFHFMETELHSTHKIHRIQIYIKNISIPLSVIKNWKVIGETYQKWWMFYINLLLLKVVNTCLLITDCNKFNAILSNYPTEVIYIPPFFVQDMSTNC